MKNKKNIIIVLLLLMVCTLVGCTSDNTKDKLSIVTTIYPQYDWINEIIGEENKNITTTMLLDSGVDLHNYQPTSTDIITISRCDMFVYVGGESDSWVDDVLAQAKNKDMIVVKLFDVLSSDLISFEHDDHDEDHEEEHDHNHEEYDEHIWLSIKNAKKVCQFLTEKIKLLDKENEDKYQSNLDTYLSKLDELDSEYQNVINNATLKTIVFADRFPFRYLANDYNLTYYAAFSGCSAEAEVSFETIISLANVIDELNIKNIFIIDGSDGAIANTVKNSTKTKDQTILKINSLQSMSKKEINEGNNYLTVMRENLNILGEALK